MTHPNRLHWDEPLLAQEVASSLRAFGWAVEMQPVLELYRPDLVATAPSGNVYAIELKSGSKAIHFGAIAQVAAYRSALSAFRGVQAAPVLFATGGTSPALDDLARSMDVLLVAESGEPPASEVPQRFVKKLVDFERHRSRS